MTGVGSSPALATCETSQVLLADVPGDFSRSSAVFAHVLIGPSHMSWGPKTELKKKNLVYSTKILVLNLDLGFKLIYTSVNNI